MRRLAVPSCPQMPGSGCPGRQMGRGSQTLPELEAVPKVLASYEAQPSIQASRRHRAGLCGPRV